MRGKPYLDEHVPHALPHPAFLISAAILLFFAALTARRAMRIARLLRQLQTIRPVPISETHEGQLQLVRGTASTPAPIPSAFQQRPAAYYAFRVEDRRPAPDKPRRLAVGKDWAPLEIEDETGSALVESRPAYIRSPHEHATRLGKLDAIPAQHAEFFEDAGISTRHLGRFQNLHVVEYTLEPGDEVHVLGTVRSHAGRKVFYRAKNSPLAVSKEADAGLVPGYRNELLLFSVSAALLAAFAAVFLVVSFA